MWSAPVRRSSRGELLALAPRRARRSAHGACGCSCRRAAGGRSRGRRATGRRRRAAPARAGRAPRARSRGGGCSRRSSGVRQSRGPRKSETTTTSPRCAGEAARARERVGEVGARRRRARARRAARAAAAAVPGAPAAAAATRALARAERHHAEPVALARGEVADRDRGALGHVGLAAVGGAEAHRRPSTSSSSHVVSVRSATCTRTCGSPRARGHGPVDLAHVVAELVGAHLRDLGAVAERRRSGARPARGYRCAAGRSGRARAGSRPGSARGPGVPAGALRWSRTAPHATSTRDSDHLRHRDRVEHLLEQRVRRRRPRRAPRRSARAGGAARRARARCTSSGSTKPRPRSSASARPPWIRLIEPRGLAPNSM